MRYLQQTSALAISIAIATMAISATAEAKSKYEKVEVAFVLDTTGSMSGLIEGAKQKIWSIANEIIDVESSGQTKVSFALIGYRDRGDAYVTKSYDMTDDIHGIYGNLLQFKAQGGGDRPESVNQALYEAVNDLSWSNDNKTLRMVFLVGDAPPHMDYDNDIQYPQTTRLANNRDIIINTVQAGRDSETSRIWRTIAKLGQGDYVAIPQDGGMQVINSPYDQDIEVLQQRISNSTMGYGNAETRKRFRSKRDTVLGASSSVASDMAEYRLKAGKSNQVITGVNELIEDYEDGKIKLEEIDVDDLPNELKNLTAEERQAKVETLVAERVTLNKKLETLVKQRETFVETKRKQIEAETKDDAFDTQIRKSIERQMKSD
ncbi:MAG: VWA domain-containing protein [Robiginitomaculum sp.]|nr:VWA domain-containing protein [Robiginitomaculum sp.]